MIVVESTSLVEVVSFVPSRFGDSRGYFCESYNEEVFSKLVGEKIRFVQDNESFSSNVGTVRGLHFQVGSHAQGKLVRVTSGKLLDVCVDIRISSPTFAKYIVMELDAQTGRQLWVPPGFAHGFCTLEPNTIISYKVTDFYNAEHDRSLRWDDPEINISWPIEADPATLSNKDAAAETLEELRAKGDLFG